jgi:hypothetical protein
MEHICGCGVKFRLDIQFLAGAGSGQFYRHCERDKGQYYPGPIIAVWEERNSAWVRA